MTHQLKTLKKDFMTMKTNKDHSCGCDRKDCAKVIKSLINGRK